MLHRNEKRFINLSIGSIK